MPSNTENNQLQLFPLISFELGCPNAKIIEPILLQPGHV